MDAVTPMTTIDLKRSALLRSSMMTRAERTQGRFMRAPDGHDAAPAPAAPSEGEAPAGDASPAPVEGETPAGDAVDPTILGGDAPSTDGEPAKPDGEGDASPAGAPEAYEIKAPEGMTLDADALALAEPIFREINLDNAAAQKLTDAYAQLVPQIAEKAVTADRAAQQTLIVQQRAAWAAEAKADPEIGGAHWDASIAASAKALDRLGAPAGSPFRELLNDSGLGNHPEMIRMFAKIGKSIGEDTGFNATENTPAVKKDAAEILYPNQAKGA